MPSPETTNSSHKIFVAGHNGMVGSAIVRALSQQGTSCIITQARKSLDLLDQKATYDFLKSEKPNQIYLAAAHVGGIYANNSYPAEFIHNNLVIQSNVIHGAYEAGVPQLLFLGSSCIYPKHAEQPLKEQSILSGPLEPTNEPYAIAKIAGLKMCESYNRQYGTDYRTVMPTNLYGPGDNYHPENSHVIPALLRRIHEAHIAQQPEVSIWGTGKARREFLHVDDLASACLHIMSIDKNSYTKVISSACSHINIGYGKEITIEELAHLIANTIGYKGSISFDTTKPDGTPRKLLDSSLLSSLGWNPCISLEEGIQKAYNDFKEFSVQLLRA